MDHHCPFVGNCVGAMNHKYFWNLLLYTTLGSLHVLISLLFLREGAFNEKIQEYMKDIVQFILIIMVFSITFSTCILFISTTEQILSNKTTIESKTLKGMENPFNKGWKENMKEVCGSIKWKWFLPIESDV